MLQADPQPTGKVARDHSGSRYAEPESPGIVKAGSAVDSKTLVKISTKGTEVLICVLTLPMIQTTGFLLQKK